MRRGSADPIRASRLSRLHNRPDIKLQPMPVQHHTSDVLDKRGATLQSNDNAAEGVLCMAMEVSDKHWKLVFSDGGEKRRHETMEAGSRLELVEAIGKAKAKFHLSPEARLVSCYEAGRDGFWLHRYLRTLRIANEVVARFVWVACRRPLSNSGSMCTRNRSRYTACRIVREFRVRVKISAYPGLSFPRGPGFRFAMRTARAASTCFWK